MHQTFVSIVKTALLAGAAMGPAWGLPTQAENRPHSAVSRATESPANGEFFMESRPPASDALPDSEVRGPVEPIEVDRERLYYQSSEESTWVRGKTYKAEVSAHGFTYIPFLGSRAPRNYPVSVRLENASLGGHEIEIDDLADVRRTGDRVTLDRGAVRVHYDFAIESVEQSFALDVAGQTSDLTLELEVVTELAGEPLGDGFSFGNDLGAVQYSEAFVLDGTGRSAHVPAELDGSRLTLTVSAAFLSSATGPILVDPLFTTYVVDSAEGFQRDIEVAYSNQTDRFLYVYEDQFSGTDVDIYATDITSGGQDPRGDYMDFGTDDWTDPSAASIYQVGTSLVAATSSGPTGNFIVTRVWDYGPGAFLGGTVQLTTPNPSLTFSGPDVGGTWTNGYELRYVVVWTADFGPDSDAQGAILASDGTFMSSLFLDSSLDHDSTDICISKSAGDPGSVNRWNVSWINRRLANNVHSVEVTQLNAVGSVVFPHESALTLPAGSSIDELDVSDAITFPEVSTPVYTIAYDQSSSAEEDTFIAFITGSNLIRSVELQESEHAELSLDQAEARLACNAEEFMVSYLEEDGSGNPYQAFITAFDFTEGQFLSISERRVPLGPVGAPSGTTTYTVGGGAALASRYSGGLISSLSLAAGHDVGIGSSANVQGHLYFPSNGYSPAFQYCYGNPNSTGDRGFIRLSGDRSVTGVKDMVATALPPDTFGYFLVASDFATVANPGTSAGVLCVGGDIGRFSNDIANSGPSGSITVSFSPQQLPQPDGAIAALPGEFWQFTLWHRDSVGGVATSNFTNAVSILFE